MDKDTILQWNISIDFSTKNNWTGNNFPKRRPNNNFTKWPDQDLTSEAFLRHKKVVKKEKIDDVRKLIKPNEEPVRICSLLWLEQVWQCMFIEYQNDIIIIDVWMQFAAKDELGADYIVPDVSYLKRNKKKIRGLLLTHGHLDHVWALKDVIADLDYPTIYTTPLTLGIVKKTFDDVKEANKLQYKIIDPDVDLLKLWCFTMEFVRVNHNIPETLAMAIHTPKWLIFNSADFKIDHTPAIDKPADLWKIARIGMEWVKLYIWDSLWCNRQGWSMSEKVIGENLDGLIKNTRSRMIIATFASNIWRIIQIIESAIKYNKVIFLSWRSMNNNVEICQQLWYINVPKGYIRKLDNDVENMPDERVVILSTWAQWEEFAWLTRMAKWDHAALQLKKWDTILMSSSTIPWNEEAVRNMINDLVVREVNLVTNYDIDIHASWHWYVEDHKLMISLLKPEYMLPFYQDAAMRYDHKKIGLDMWMDEQNILMPEKNWDIIEMYDDVILVSDKSLKLDTILVDWKWVWHLSGEYVVRARHIMANNGTVALILKIDTQSKKLIWNIQIESRGFVYSSEVKDIHTQIVDFVRSKYNDNLRKNMEVRDNLKQIKEDLWQMLIKVIEREPMVIPMFVYINREAMDPKIEALEIATPKAKEDWIIWMTLEEQGYDN